MRHYFTMALLAASFTFFWACGGDAPSSNTGNTPASTADTLAANLNEPPPPSHNCTLAGNMLEGNEVWVKDIDRLVVVTADSSTYDTNLGDSHRIVEVYDTRSCQRIARHVLPVSMSPDFAYFVAQINYNKVSHLVGIRGFNQIYIYDLTAQKLMPALKATFQSTRFSEDAQSGMIKRLEIWEDFLIGFAEDRGSFAFDLSTPAAIKPVMPFGEYAVSETEFASLFLLESDGGGMQAILPRYDPNTEEFAINPLLSKPAELEINIPRSARNNRHLVIREKSAANAPIAIDMSKYSRVELPEDIRSKPTQAILEWMRQQK